MKGDLIFFDFPKESSTQHVGVVIKAHHRTGWRHRYWKHRFMTVEANVKDTNEKKKI